MLALPYLWCQSLVPEFVSATIQIRQCCIPIGCNDLLLSLKLDVLHRTSHPEFKPGREVIFHSVKYEAQNLMRPTLDLNKIQATITTAHLLYPAIGGIFRKFRMRPIEVSTTPCFDTGSSSAGGERPSRRHRAGEVHRLVLQPHHQVAHGRKVGHPKLWSLLLSTQGKRGHELLIKYNLARLAWLIKVTG